MSVRPGTRLDGRYRLSDRLAYGGMGEVWRATDEVLSREVAVKILRPELAEDEAFVRRFRAEARTTSGLPHNGIAAVYDYGETRVGNDGSSPAPYDDEEADPVAYLVMELVPGEALSSILSRDGALGSDRTLDLVAQAARALHAAHLRGVIHRDIKPANLMVTPDERVKVTDFGIARPLDHEPLTATGQVMGTAHYLAPELAKGQDASPLSDVYALGVVAYECLAGHRPFEGDNQVAVALAHLNEQPPPLPATIPDSVRAVVMAAMEKDPQRRMPSAEALAAALEALRYRPGNDEPQQFTPPTGVLPGSATEAGLRAAGLLGPEQRGWTPGLPSGRNDGFGAPQPAHPGHAAQPASLPSGTHVLGPVAPRTGGMTGAVSGGMPGGMAGGMAGGSPAGMPGGLLGGPGGPGGSTGGYGSPPGGYPDPGDPFRTPTAPGGLSVTPGGRVRERRRSGAGAVIAIVALAIVVGLVMLVLYIGGYVGGGDSKLIPGGDGGTPTTTSTSSRPAVVSPSTSRPTSSSTRRSTRTTTTTTTRSSTTQRSTSSTTSTTTQRSTQPTETSTTRSTSDTQTSSSSQSSSSPSTAPGTQTSATTPPPTPGNGTATP